MDVDAVVLVTSADALVSSALARLLDVEPRFAVRESSAQGAADIDRACRDAGANVVILDAGSEPEATLAAIRTLRKASVTRGAIAVVGCDSAQVAAEMFTAGANGVVARDAAPAELIAAVDEVSSGHVFASRTAMRLLLERLETHTAGSRPRSPLPHGELSERERVAVAHLARGMTNLEIARSMFVSEGTVKAYLGRAMTKWGVRDRVQLVIRALGADIAEGSRHESV